jgi:[ribosomal protein S18]-alanine N-acetyltransferase
MSRLCLLVDAATEDDLPALLTLERLCHTHPWTEQNFVGEIADPERGRLLALRDLARVGEADRGLRGYCAFQVVVDEMHLVNLVVTPGLRRQGHGRWLLDLALELGGRRGAKAAFLEVRASNEAALALYEAAGFSYLFTRRDYYARPREDAVVLRKSGLAAPPPNLEIGRGTC